MLTTPSYLMTDINLNHFLLHEPLILTVRGSGDGIRMGSISVSHIPGVFRTFPAGAVNMDSRVYLPSNGFRAWSGARYATSLHKVLSPESRSFG